MTTTATDPNPTFELADRLFAAIVAGDLATIEQIYAPDAAVWHNTDGRTQDVAQNLRTLQWLHEHVQDLRYEEIRRQLLSDGFVQQHVLRARTASGASIEVPACLVVKVIDGHISRLDEYLDSAHIGALLTT